MKEWVHRLKKELEPVLSELDPRPTISAYHDMPYAIFRYPPKDEFEVRKEVSLLRTRLEQRGKRVTVVSLAECMWEALEKEGLGPESLGEAERRVGVRPAVETVHSVLSEYQPLDELVASKIPGDAIPTRDIVFIVRAGVLFPVYRASALVEQMKGKVAVPAILFYPGVLEGAAGLKFLGKLEPDHHYRPKIF